MTASRKTASDQVAFALFLLTLAGVSFVVGALAAWAGWLPSGFLYEAKKGLSAVRERADPAESLYYVRIDRVDPAVDDLARVSPGLNLVTRVGAERRLVAEILELDGTLVHRWDIDWFSIWSDASHLPEPDVPKSRPGAHIHGAVLMEGGDLVFNFEHLGLVRLDPGGRVVWRLPYRTHHSVHLDEDGTLWVCGQRRHDTPDPRFPNRPPPFDEYTLLQVAPDGEILSEWSVADLLVENGLRGLMHLGSVDNESTVIRGDVLHLNDLEPFPESMEEGFFRRGDILVSLRNINTVFVFNRNTRRIGFICSGWFVRQHDPDFLDGNRFSVFDNYNLGPEKLGHQSRIVVVDAAKGTREVVFEGTAQSPFYTHIMGKHQWLPGGNLLITESMKGRAFEVTPGGERVWSYSNEVGTGLVGIVEEVQRVPASMRRRYVPADAGDLGERGETVASVRERPRKTGQ